MLNTDSIKDLYQDIYINSLRKYEEIPQMGQICPKQWSQTMVSPVDKFYYILYNIEFKSH